MMPVTSIVYLVSGVSLAYAAVTLLLVARYYGVAELKTVGVFKALLALALLTAFVYQEALAGAMLGHGLGYGVAMGAALLGSGPLRGPEIGVAWYTVLAQGFLATTVLLAAAAIHGSCTVSSLLGLTGSRMKAVVGGLSALAVAAVALTAYAVAVLNPYTPMDPAARVEQGLAVRDAANALKAAAVGLPLALLTAAYAKTYIETRERMFLGYTVSALLLLAGWLVIGASTLTFWERMAVVAGAAGQAALASTLIAALLFLSAGSAGMLIVTVAGYATPRQA